ncbi:mammalian cell entry protein [Antrihabitans sp. YC3-6]|uniref:Mammalian cell entry protein n=1 Tax=Antrihabitans stalagmiti TaxID=2799499 RepID=A0A934NUV0_9NOCA|nr:mammalian cell entry protein [Antrihabitans stalagmiti]MBJ8342013.1 mammalian cell entry protein [Antrihabitans stalagmiti]
MPLYGMPGVPTTRRTSLLVGVATLVVVLTVGLVWHSIATAPDENAIQVQLRTDVTGDGVADGTGVRLNGTQIGHVTAVDSDSGGTQVLTLGLDRAALVGLTDNLRIEYAPANLFGISEVVLLRGDGGTPLADGDEVDLTGGERVRDSTMGTMLRSLSQTTTTVLTPQLTEILTQVGNDVDAFAPFIEALVSVSRAVADSQRYPTSFLIEQYASFFNGVAVFGSGFVELIDRIYNIDVLRNDRERFDIGVSLVVDQLFPLIRDVLGTARGSLGGYSDTLAVVLGQLARTVPDPNRSHTELTELIDRLDRTFRTTPNGPQVDVDVLVRGMPGLMVPLTGGAKLEDGVR